MRPLEPQYECGEPGRVLAVGAQKRLNGIDYLEVASDDQTTLRVAFVLPLPGAGNAGEAPPGAPKLTADNVRIEGGVRVRGIRVLDAQTSGSDLLVTTSAAGDFSTYTLRLVATGAADDVANDGTTKVPDAPAGFDPRLSQIAFSFKAGCRSEFDCEQADDCPPDPLTEPLIDYRAKDYATFRRLMLDRLNALMPTWRDRSPADPLVTLVESLALTADHLSYWQDAIATEAYLGTARRRVSVRRHARMLDYRMHDGCNARTWVHFATRSGSGTTLVLAGTKVLTRGREEAVVLDESELADALVVDPVVFETMHDAALRPEHGAIALHTWSDAECCLPRGATRATLVNDPALAIAAGDWLLFEEVYGAVTGIAADADPDHRQVVRLTEVTEGVDPIDGTPILEIAWDQADALRFPLCLDLAPNPLLEAGTRVSIARANLALADHGMTRAGEPLRFEPDDTRAPRATLAEPGLTFAVPFDANLFADEAAELADPIDERVLGTFLTAAEAMDSSADASAPCVSLTQGIERWQPRRDLLASDRFAAEFVVEMESDGTAMLRFGDDVAGRRPAQGAAFTATYRVGNGRAGNVGAETLARVVAALPAIVSVRNPLPAVGGIDPESMEAVKQFAPQAFRTQERAVTADDWAEVSQRDTSVQRAVAQFRWTGSWHTVFVAVDRRGGLAVEEDPRFMRTFKTHLDRYRLAGYDLEIEGAVFRPLDIALSVCAKPGYFRSDVKEQLLALFDARAHRDGTRGFFHPDNFTFGQAVYASRIYEAAMRVAGVESVRVVRFQRYGKLPANELADGVIPMAPSEVARCDNDPSFPEAGRFEVSVEGGL